MKIFEDILLDIVIGILLKSWRTDRNSVEQWKYIATFEFSRRQADNKRWFESPDITKLAQLLFQELLVAQRTIVGDNGNTLYCRPIPTLKRIRPIDASHPSSVLRHYCWVIVASTLKLWIILVASSATARSFAKSCKSRALTKFSRMTRSSFVASSC